MPNQVRRDGQKISDILNYDTVCFAEMTAGSKSPIIVRSAFLSGQVLKPYE